MATEPFLQLRKSKEVEEFVSKETVAFKLLTIIALRARRTSDVSISGLEKCEAFVGDFYNHGLTREQYRYNLQKLKKLGFITIKTTNKGTIVKIVDKRIYDINEEQDNQQNHKRTTNRLPSNNHQTTNEQPLIRRKEERRKEEKKERSVSLLEDFSKQVSDKGDHYQKIKIKYMGQGFDEYTIDQILEEFIGYWTEPTKKGTERWQEQDAFAIDRRIDTFFKTHINKGRSKKQEKQAKDFTIYI